MAKKLTVRGLDAIKPVEARKEYPDGLVSGLYLVVQPSGKRSWAVRYRVGGRTRKHTIGSASAIDLVKARELARAALVEVAKGNDPGEDKKAARNAKPRLTVAGLISTYVENYAKKETKPAVARETERALRNAFTSLEKRPVDSIVRRDLKDIIDDRLTDGQKATAIRLRALFSKMFKWAIDEEYLAINPCLNLPKIKAPDSVERNLSFAELHAVVTCALTYDVVFGTYIKFLICTGQRRTMTAEMVWEEFDHRERTWTIPKSRTKNKKEHLVHVSQYAYNCLLSLKDHYQKTSGDNSKLTGAVFRNSEGNPISGFSDRKAAFDLYMVEKGHDIEPWTLHDLRRTASTSMSELGVDQVIIDFILSHQTARTKDVSFIYNRNQQLTKRREALDKWGKYLDSLDPWSKPVNRERFGADYDAQKLRL